MTSEVQGDPPRAHHQEILEEEQDKTYHVVDVLPRCRHIMDIG